MIKYIWLTIGMIALILVLAYKQAPNEPELERPVQEEGLPAEALAEEGEAIASESGNIKVTRPQPNNTISSPLLVKGEARVFEGTVQMRLKDADNNVIVEKFGTAQAAEAGEFGAFGELLLFDEVTSESGTLEVYSIDARDGAEIDLVSIPIKF